MWNQLGCKKLISYDTPLDPIATSKHAAKLSIDIQNTNSGSVNLRSHRAATMSRQRRLISFVFVVLLQRVHTIVMLLSILMLLSTYGIIPNGISQLIELFIRHNGITIVILTRCVIQEFVDFVHSKYYSLFRVSAQL